MFGRLLLLFIFVPIIELYFLALLISRITLMPTIGLIVLTGIIGAGLARAQGLSTMRKIKEEMRQGRPPAQELVEGVMILIGGIALMTPGILTDLFGFAMLLPGIRKSIARKLKENLMQSVAAGKPPSDRSSGPRKRDDDVIGV